MCLTQKGASMHRLLHTTCVILLALFIGTICGCALRSPASQDRDVKGPLGPARDLGSVEIDQYEGKPLTDFKALPDNSVRGPQSVDLPSYRLVVDGAVRSPQRLTYAEVLRTRATRSSSRFTAWKGGTRPGCSRESS